MMTRRSSSLVFLLAMLILAPGHGEAAGTSEAYTAGPIGDAVNKCRQDNPSGLNVAAACVGVSGGQLVSVAVNDDLSENVDFFWIFKNAAGQCVGEPSDPLGTCPNDGFAQDRATLVAPSGAVRLELWLSGPVFASLNGADPATTGVVVFTK